jgi:rod shape determining protein RodA
MQGIDRRLLQNFEWQVPLVAILLAGIGIVNLVSAGSAEGGDGFPATASRQLSWLGLGAMVMLAAIVVDYRKLERVVPLLYAGGIGMLIVVLLFGRTINGAQSWLAIGPIRFQPSEVLKLIIVLVFARLLAKRESKGPLTLIDLALPGLLLLAPVALIQQQPDLGTSTLVVLGAVTVLCMVSIQMKTLVVAGVTGLAGVVGAWFFYLRAYQRERILAFLSPGSDPHGVDYQVTQSQIAVGSGELFGKGWGEGSQTQLHFLPEQQTDFVFSVLGEEWGFVGASVVLLIYAAFLLRGLAIGRASKDAFGAYLAVGIVGMFFWATTINVAMVLGLFPVVGVPMPLLSYGGSSLVTSFAALGLLMNVSMRRYVF